METAEQLAELQREGFIIIDDPMAYGEDYPFTVQVRAPGVGDPSQWKEYDGCVSAPPDLSELGVEISIETRIIGPEKAVAKTVKANGQDLGRHKWQKLEVDSQTFNGEICVKELEFRSIPGIISSQFQHLPPMGSLQFKWMQIRRKLRDQVLMTPGLQRGLEFPIIAFPLGIVDRLLDSFLGIKRCGNCAKFDRKQGHDYYTRETHPGTMAGDRKMNMDIGEQVASERGLRSLNPAKIGLCLKHETLIEDDFGGCTDWCPLGGRHSHG